MREQEGFVSRQKAELVIENGAFDSKRKLSDMASLPPPPIAPAVKHLLKKSIEPLC